MRIGAAAKSQRLARGVTVNVRVRGRTVRLGKVVALKPYVERSLTVRATGAKLRRAARKGALTGEIIVRTIGGRTPVTATTKVLR